MSAPSSPLRLFVDIELPPPVIEHMTAIQEQLRPQLPVLRWVRPENAHLTLTFIGATPADRLPDVEGVLARRIEPFPPFQLRTGDLGTFGGTRARVLWLGLGGELERLIALQRTVEAALAEIGMAGEGGRFSPHLTLARLPDDTTETERQRVRQIASAMSPEPRLFNVSRIVLVRSQLSAAGASYTIWRASPPKIRPTSVYWRNSIESCSGGGTVENPKLLAERIVENVENVIVGKTHEVRLALVALLCGGHLLIEDVPGVGKTILARSLARSTGCTFRRIQFTPDLLPSDITGVSIYNQRDQNFEFRPGPIFAQIVLADEINRATPKTQSALLEAMEERQVTVDGVTRPVPHPFMVMATQNPIEYEGTFPLPEAQLDRFILRLHLGYPSNTDEVLIMDRQQHSHPVEDLDQITNESEIGQLQAAVKAIYVDPLIKQYIVSLVESTRQHPGVYLGASPRGSLALYRTTQAMALLDGRDYVAPDDVKALAYGTLGHRVIVNPSSRVKNVTPATVIQECLERIPVPGARARGGSPSTST